MISFSCDNCGKKFKVSNDKGGKTAKCPGCGRMLHIPLADGIPPSPLGVRPAARTLSQAPHRPYYPHHRHAGAQTRSVQAGRQRANMILLGVILLIGFGMPIIQINPFTGQRHGEFVNITSIAREDVSMQRKMLYLAPGVAGIGLLMLQGFTKHPVRGAVIIFLAAMPVLISLTNLQIIEAPTAFPTHIPAQAAFTMLVFFLGWFVAPVALLVGVRSRGYRPGSSVAYWFGVAGAGAWFAFLVMPILPAELGYIFLVLPIELMGQPGAGGVSMGLLVLMVCTIISAVLCIINKPTSEPRRARSQANLAYWTLIIGFVVFMLCVSGQFIKDFPTFINTLKDLCEDLGMFLLFPAGITDLVVGRAHHYKHRSHETPHPHTAGPDIPRRVV